MVLFIGWMAVATGAAQSLSFVGGTLSENFDGMGPGGTSLPTGWFVGWAGASVTFSTTVAVNDGSIAPNQNAGWNFGAAGSSDRALGLMATSSGTPTPPGADRFIEVHIQNNSTGEVRAIEVRYDGEEWRTGSSSSQVNSNVLQFSADGVSFASMGAMFQFAQPVFTPISSALDGNAAANRRTNIGGVFLLPAAVPPGGIIYLRWYDLNDASTDPGLALDNFSFSVPANVPSAPSWQWAREAGSMTAADYGDGIALDGDGAVYVTGNYASGADFGGSILFGGGLFVARYDAAGVLEWVRGANSASGAPVGHTVAADQLGNCYVTGSFDATTTFGSTNVTSAGGSDVFVAKYDRAGTLLWVSRQGGGYDDSGRGVAVDGTNGCFVTGLLQSSSGATSRDIFVAKYNSDGVLKWQRQPASTASDAGMAAASDQNGNAYITGWFTSTANFSSTNVTAVGARDIFAAKYDGSGSALWVVTLGGSSGDEGKGIGVDADGNVYVTGSFNIGGGTTSSDAEKLLLTKISPVGSVLWQRELLAPFNYIDFSSATDSSGNTWVAGAVLGGGSVSGISFGSSGGYDGVIVKYDAAGAVAWIGQIGGANTVIPHRVALDSVGRCYVTGEFGGQAQFGNTNLASSGGTNIFIARLGAERVVPVRLALEKTNAAKALQVFGAAGSLVTIEASADLPNASWMGITNLILSSNSVRWIDSDTYPRRFYRAKFVP